MKVNFFLGDTAFYFLSKIKIVSQIILLHIVIYYARVFSSAENLSLSATLIAVKGRVCVKTVFLASLSSRYVSPVWSSFSPAPLRTGLCDLQNLIPFGKKGFHISSRCLDCIMLSSSYSMPGFSKCFFHNFILSLTFCLYHLNCGELLFYIRFF